MAAGWKNQCSCDSCNTTAVDNSAEKVGRTRLQSWQINRKQNLWGPSVFTLSRCSLHAEILAWATFHCYAIWPDLKNLSLYSAIHCRLEWMNQRWKISSLFSIIQLHQAHLKYENGHCKTNSSESELEDHIYIIIRNTSAFSKAGKLSSSITKLL